MATFTSVHSTTDHTGITGVGGGPGAGAVLQVSRDTINSGDLTTTSTSFVDVTGLSITITTGANRCMVFFNGSAKQNTNDANVAFDIDIDGSRLGGTFGLVLANRGTAGTSAGMPIALAYLTDALSAASHTFKVQWRVDAGTGTLFASTSVAPAVLTVIEYDI